MEHYAPLALGPAIPTQHDFQHVISWGRPHNSGASAPVETVPPRMSLDELQDIEVKGWRDSTCRMSSNEARLNAESYMAIWA